MDKITAIAPTASIPYGSLQEEERFRYDGTWHVARRRQGLIFGFEVSDRQNPDSDSTERSGVVLSYRHHVAVRKAA